ncbi:hypothetical protein SPACI_031480 [Sporomusa acidovorans DSM 3132]|uniref:L,D-TPase catalytic domain-containing protein n=1 Tax=Sporomusa acidovorans (strain ATCC 49682 / DSM 3132 / Mol) TaxID=1123286 RepID=A0ABZ3J4R6_SPOA4|nr:L,D-transpeptidase family protein [Sporomusa acidovorans]OZC13386.1 putative L,D-transpeptidase YkuD [Sporomusa acidovorans DSM 3132]SDF78632.1 L,D-transpeptidase catalytic domain [Sporomusa acidovorans]
MLLRFILWFYVLICLAGFSGYVTKAAAIAGPSITVNLPSRTIELFVDDTLLKEFPIAIGKPSTPTPLGKYSVLVKEINPDWYPPDQPGRMVPSGPDNPLGYRWLGIYNNYGIHGTNAPDSIGSAVSNGCIRMYEADVEELFDLVNYGTPVKITYDRIKVRTNARGQVVLSVYPDIYGYGSIDVQDIRNKLNGYHLNGLVNDEMLRKMIDNPSDDQFVIAKQFKIKVSGKLTSVRGLVLEDVPYVPAYATAELFNRQINWDEKNKTVQYAANKVPGIVISDVVYITVNNLRALFGCEPSWNAGESTLVFARTGVFLNGKAINIELNKVEGMLAMPAIPLAKALGRKVSWDQDKQILTTTDKENKVNIPVSLVDSVPYIKITNINQYFGVYVYWNEEAKTIELTYP